MLAMINRLLEWFKSLFWKDEMELTLVGLQHAGKTTFVNVIASGQFNEDMIPTVGFNMRKITKGNVTIKLWDIGGQPRFRFRFSNINFLTWCYPGNGTPFTNDKIMLSNLYMFDDILFMQ